MKKNTFNIAITSFFIVFIFVLILLSPLMQIIDVTITGNKKLENSYILELSGLNDNKNIFIFSEVAAKKKLLKNPYVETVKIKKHYLQKTVDIIINERVLSGYVEYTPGNYLYIDENGYILEVAQSFTERLPIVVGLGLKPFTVGQILDVSNPDSFETLVTVSHLINKYDLETDVVKVSLHDENNTHLYVNNIDVELGDIRDADEKIRTLKVILQTLEDKEIKGFLDLKDINKPTSFRILT